MAFDANMCTTSSLVVVEIEDGASSLFLSDLPRVALRSHSKLYRRRLHHNLSFYNTPRATLCACPVIYMRSKLYAQTNLRLEFMIDSQMIVTLHQTGKLRVYKTTYPN
jgi:hypothetical protein